MSQLGLSTVVHFQSTCPIIVAYSVTQTQVDNKDLNIANFAVTPDVGTYILGACGTVAHRVESFANGEACGHKLQVMFVSEPIQVSQVNNHGAKGVEIEVHVSKCNSQVVDRYFLSRAKGYKINATLSGK